MKKTYDETAVNFRRLFESAPGLMLILAPDLHIIAVSQAYLDATMTSRDRIIGRYIFEVFPDNPDQLDADGVSNLHASLKRVLQHKQPDTMAVQRYDIRRPESEGGGFVERYWSPVNTPVMDEDQSTILYIIHQVSDVTDFVRLREQNNAAAELRRKSEQMEIEILTRSRELHQARTVLEEKNNELTRSYAEMESFAYSVSHDLRAPLRAINGYAQMLAEDYIQVLDSEGRRLLGEVQRNSRKMGELIDDLLALSRLGRKEMRKTSIDMLKLTREAIKEIGTKDLDRTTVEIGHLDSITGDESLIRQVLTNLLSNAVKYSSRSAHPRVSVSSEKKGAEVIYTVSDNGVGFDMAYAGKLFGVFQRLHSQAEFEGTGVGLAIVRRIVERHGGEVWAEGRLHEGATFYFSLPVTEENKSRI